MLVIKKTNTFNADLWNVWGKIFTAVGVVAITGSVVYNAGIDPSTALATEDIQDHLVLQVVVKEENKDAEWAKAIVDAYHSDEFKQYMEENNDGLWWIPDELK